MLTRIFRSGNSLAVRIPKELAFEATVQEVEIERRGDELLIRPVGRRSFEGLEQALAAFPPEFMSAGRASNEQVDRDWSAPGEQAR